MKAKIAWMLISIINNLVEYLHFHKIGEKFYKPDNSLLRRIKKPIWQIWMKHKSLDEHGKRY
ncbi:MAG: hypothetical protein AABY22_35045 [Nanoarchaeota archaeon]